jgi:zinc protease
MKQRAFRLIFVALALLAMLPIAEAAAARKLVSIEGVTEYRLDNGLRVLALPEPSADTVTVHVVYLVGSRHEGYGEKGMAHLLEHMLFKGSKRHPRIKEEFAQRGARWNGSTGPDRTNYFETVPAGAGNLDWALGLEADRMLNSFIAKADLDSEMTVVRNEFEMGENNPGSVLYQRMQRLAYSWHNYGYSVIGARSDIENVPIERLRAFYRTWYRPDNAVLIVAGRIDEARAVRLVEKHFGRLPRPKRAMPALYTSDPTQDGERSVTLRRVGDNPLVAAMYRIPAAGHPDSPAIDVLVNLLGAAPTGRLHAALVQKGLASSVWSTDQSMHDPGVAYFGAALPKDASLDAARDTLLGVLDGIRAAPIRDDEVTRAKIELLNDFEKTRLDASSYVHALAEFSALGDWRLFFLYRDRLKAVTVADVNRVATAYLKPANRVIGEFVPTASPDRAEIPASPDLNAALEGYRGGERVETGEAFDPSPANIEARVIRKTLRNDIHVALLPKKSRGGSVVATVALHWGDEASRTGRETACALAGNMLLRGSLRHDRAQLRDAFERLNATVSVGIDGASIEVKRAQLADTLRLVAEVLRQPSFKPEEFEELKRATLTGIEGQRTDPEAMARMQLSRHLTPYPKGHPLYVETPSEQISIVTDATLEQSAACYRELVGATNADFAVVGDFDADEVARLIDELFGDWQSGHPFRRVTQHYFERAALERELRTPDKANAVLKGGINVALRDDDPDFPALVLGSYLLGGTSTARIPNRVREKDGLSYSAYAWFAADAFDPVASFRVSAIFAPQNAQRIDRDIREELERALRDGFSDEEVQAAKEALVKQRRLSRTQDRALTERLGWYLYLGRTFDWDASLESRIGSLTAAQVQQALRKHVDLDKLSIVTAGDFK